MTMLDVRCFDDLDAYGAEITDPLESLKQDNYHRLTTPPGQNIDDPDSGLGLPRLLSGSDHDIVSLGPRIEAELRNDPRNAEVRVLVKLVNRGEYDIAIAIVPDPEKVGSVAKDLLMQLRARGADVDLL